MSPSRGFTAWAPLAAMSGGLLVWGNVLVPALPAATGLRTAVNLGTALAVLVVARAAGLGWRELGLARGTWRPGAAWGGAALGLAAASYAVALLIPATRVLVEDPRVEGLSVSALLVRALVLIPLGTVLAEEVLFRGVLLATASRFLPAGAALAVTAVVFGLWHLSTARRPAGAGVSPVLSGASIAGTVLVTALGGLAFGWLRQRTGSLLAPIGLHLGTNSVGLVAAAIAVAAR